MLRGIFYNNVKFIYLITVSFPIFNFCKMAAVSIKLQGFIMEVYSVSIQVRGLASASLYIISVLVSRNNSRLGHVKPRVL